MDDLISRAAAIEICKSIVPNTNPDFYNLRSKAGYGSWMHSNGEVCAITNIETKIEALPAVDAVSVVHGRWVDEEGNPVPWCDALPSSPAYSCWCNQCGTWLVASDEYPVYGLFCPACGAKMDGELDG